ncbi:serine phosphatase RsbU (regulator of sigma subunit) [Crossiella equi]|uniref:Serine phosphatase RsbU (Regulator of sigma subunit) n=1 Tax=Crossiella equi TaxID=130796 RepID=A0ABS5A3T4_9PSEU|nr:SpoIIE family protein phosphatase [Crossiella equi]MBP2471206.1 serine phosphatase RsbU (regulator of sigma subunit) [Crossiella equi]
MSEEVPPPRAAQPGQSRLAEVVDRLRREVVAAHATADGRALIELAKGVLVERLHCGPAEAGRQLAGLAETAGLSQLELAADVVGQAAQDDLAELTASLTAAQDAPDNGLEAAVGLRTAEVAVSAGGDSQAIAQSLLHNALAPLGASAVAVWVAGVDGTLDLAGCAGFAEGEAQRWHHVPPGVVTAARRALVTRSSLWLHSLSESGIPSLGQRQHPDGCRFVTPAERGGRILGVLEVCWPIPLPPQPRAVQRQLEALAELCTHTLDHGPSRRWQPTARPLAELSDLADGLLDSALVLAPHRAPDGQLTDFRIHHLNPSFTDLRGRPRAEVAGALLLEAYPSALGDSGLYDKVLRVHATGEPFRASRVLLTAVINDVPLSMTADIGISRHEDNVLLVWRVEDRSARLAAVLQHAQRLGRIGGFEEDTTTGRITWNSELHDLYGRPEPVALQQLPAHAHPDDAIAVGRFLRTVLHHRRPADTAFRLLRPDGVTRHIRVVAEPVLDAVGSLLAVRGAYQDVSAQHWTEVALAATRDQLAHSELQAAERNRLALQLQHAIMPPAQAPLDAFDLQVAVRYRPAQGEHLVGGDWYDAVVLPSKQILVCVGDIAGHGINAATGMVALRNALRGLAATGAGPAQLLSWLNVVARHLTDHVVATAVCGLYDPVTRVLRWARAGHPPPVLVRGGRATVLPMLRGILLGATDEVVYQEEDLQLGAGDTLLMYTDGLIERKGNLLEESLAHLVGLAESARGTLEERLDHLLTHSNADTDDDTCLVGVELR